MAPRDDRDPTGIPKGSRRCENAVLKQLLRQNSNFATGESFAGVALAVKSVNNANYVVRCGVDSKIRGGQLDSRQRGGGSRMQINPIRFLYQLLANDGG